MVAFCERGVFCSSQRGYRKCALVRARLCALAFVNQYICWYFDMVIWGSYVDWECMYDTTLGIYTKRAACVRRTDELRVEEQASSARRCLILLSARKKKPDVWQVRDMAEPNPRRGSVTANKPVADCLTAACHCQTDQLGQAFLRGSSRISVILEKPRAAEATHLH